MEEVKMKTFWQESILPMLCRYIEVPAVSPHFDPKWESHGHIQQAVHLATVWCEQFAHELNAMVVVHSIEGRTPVLFIDIPGDPNINDRTTLLYGHLDKQPPMEGWDEGLGPWTPVARQTDDGRHRLFGRGGADDGYAVFAGMSAIVLLRRQGYKLGRCVILIETAEESGSPDLPIYLEALKAEIGTPGLIIALDSGCGTYDRLWLTTSLLFVIAGVLRVDVLTQAVHSGDAGGIVPDSFRIARFLLDRLEDSSDGNILVSGLKNGVVSSDEIAIYANKSAEAMGEDVLSHYPWASEQFRDGVRNQVDAHARVKTNSDFMR